MSNLLKHDWRDATVKWLEDDLQAAIVQKLRRLEMETGKFTFAADMNAGKRVNAKAVGIRAGEPDLRIYLPGGRLKMIELKRKGGRVSPAQIDRHEALYLFGHPVSVVVADCPADAVEQVVAILEHVGAL